MNPNTVHDYRLQSLELENSGLKKQITHLRNVKRNEAEKDVQIRSLEMERESLRAELRTKVGILLFPLAVCFKVYHSEVRASREGKEGGTIQGTVPIHATSTEMLCSYLRTQNLPVRRSYCSPVCCVYYFFSRAFIYACYCISLLVRTFVSFVQPRYALLRFASGVCFATAQFLCLRRGPA